MIISKSAELNHVEIKFGGIYIFFNSVENESKMPLRRDLAVRSPNGRRSGGKRMTPETLCALTQMNFYLNVKSNSVFRKCTLL